MDNLDNLTFKVYKIDENGTIVSAVQYDQNLYTRDIVSKMSLCTDDITFNMDSEPGELNISLKNFECDDEDNPNLNFIKLEFNDSSLDKPFESTLPHLLPKVLLNIPTMIRCQNCDTNFPTKYQYQRHQCEFNAEKVVLKPNADIKDLNKGVRIKYDCNTCGKQFVSKNNLERHQSCHVNDKENICEHCNKQFVSQNRLKIHKENHCKMVGDLSKFYRSDVAVWKCKKCHEVFSSFISVTAHVEFCKKTIVIYDITDDENSSNTGSLRQVEVTGASSLADDGNNSRTVDSSTVEKILTEILLQCEFCNRTYADKRLLLMHQRQHTTEKNYECVSCNSTFESYTAAAQHWMKICSETVNTFYLPKLTYCEYCDRTFKSHELLYLHKIKKKHYTLKRHNDDSTIGDNVKEKSVGSNVAINKLIEDVLITLNRPVNKMNNTPKPASDLETEENIDLEENLEGEGELTHDEESESAQFSNSDPPPEKKKRGRKPKDPKQSLRNKKLHSPADEGYKYQCERCPLVWNNIFDLENHREKEHASVFSCEDCDQILHSAKALLIHSRAHKSLKPYVCDTCGRSYSQTSHLWQHMRFHQGIKPFACPHEGCEARYTIRPDLKDHIRKVHTRERPFKCAVCDKCFLTGSVYYQHRLIHTNDRRYGCDICHKRFFRADALNNHKRIHTDERPYACTVCGREFRQKGDRNKHMRTQHPDTAIQ